MAIRFVTGKPGAGKGLLAMKLICEELATGTRPILTNMAFELRPWVNGAGVAQKGILAYLSAKYGRDCDAEKRLFRLTDEQAVEFFLWRRGVSGVLERATVTKERPIDGGRRKAVVEFATELMAESAGHLYVIDEAWQFWGARRWQETGEGLQFYSAQHRKAGDDLIICTQHTKQIDSAMQRLAQDFWVCKNRGLLRLGPFRQPDNFKVAVFESAPTGGSQVPMRTEVFKLDKTGLASTYDTAAGVGLMDRMVADVGKKKKGLPWWSLIVAVPVVGILGMLIFNKLVGAGARAALKGIEPPKVSHEPGKTNEVALGDVKQRVTAVDRVPVRARGFPGPVAETVRTNEVRLVGAWTVGGRGGVILSDGRRFALGPGLSKVDSEGVVILGKRVRWADEIEASKQPPAVVRADPPAARVEPSPGPVSTLYVIPR